MSKLTTTHKVTAIALLVLIGVGTGYIYLYKHIWNLQKDLVVLRDELAVMEQLAQNKEETISLLETTKTQRTELDGYFIPVEDPTPFLELIESVGRDAGVTLEVVSLSVVDVTDEGSIRFGHKDMQANLTVVGRWEQVYHLLTLLERMPYITNITQTTFLRNDSEESTWKGQIQLIGSAQ